MYRFTDEEVAWLSHVEARALAIIKQPPDPVAVDDDYARQFLTREILKMVREGQRDTGRLIADAAGLLRADVQVRQSAQRASKRGSMRDRQH